MMPWITSDDFVRAFRQVMMPRQRFAVSLFAFLASTVVLPASGFAQTTVTSERPASFTLSNGLQVVVIPDHRTPVVTQMIWYKVGSADETPGKSGLAHFLEHLMFKGTSKHPAGEFSQTVLRIGGNENAFTSVDYTGYFQRVPREQLPKMMEFEADRMTGLILERRKRTARNATSCWKNSTCGSPTIPTRG
jgi:zinc protease